MRKRNNVNEANYIYIAFLSLLMTKIFPFIFTASSAVKIDIDDERNLSKGTGMTGVSRGIEYPLLHEIHHTVSAN